MSTRDRSLGNSQNAPSATGRPGPSAVVAISLCPSVFNSASRRERCARPTSRPSSRAAVSSSGLVPVGANSQRTSLRPFPNPAAAGTKHGFPAFLLRLSRSIPRCVCVCGKQFRPGAERSFFRDRSRSLLAEPPTGAPLHGRGTFGSSLKGILPTVPSPRSAPPPRDERAITLPHK
jgi:hypothetical protein